MIRKDAVRKDKQPPKEHKPKGGLIPMMARLARAAAQDPPNAPGTEGLGKRLKWARERRGLSARALCADLGLTAEALTFYERDESTRSMSVDKCQKIAEILGLRFEWLALGTGEPFLDPRSEWAIIREAREDAHKEPTC